MCDVSGKNPNVMFELGMRLAFDKPTIIVKDDITNYSFDTSVIEHLEYPRDLRFSKIVAFKEKLRSKIVATHQKSKDDPNYSTFLKSFGEYKIAHLQNKEVSSDRYILESLDDLKRELGALRRSTSASGTTGSSIPGLDDTCISIHIAEYAQEHGISNTEELARNRAKLLRHLKSIEHVREAYGDRLPLYLKQTLLRDSWQGYLDTKGDKASPKSSADKA